jgi:hypothetical protein
VLSSIEGRTYHGPDGIRRYFADMGEAFEEWRVEVVELEELSSDTVFARFVSHAVGKSGVAGEMATFIVLTIEGGKIRRAISSGSRKESLAAAGITE